MKFKIGQEVMINREAFPFYDCGSMIGININKILKIKNVEKHYRNSPIYTIEYNNQEYHFSENELISTIPIKVKGIIEEIQNEKI
jgi:hypothetical protein